jgi:hypothetical protein
MGWTDSHLHQFEARGVFYGTSDRELGVNRISENKTTVGQVLRRPKDRMTYEYDFGDGWRHVGVVVTAYLLKDEDYEDEMGEASCWFRTTHTARARGPAARYRPAAARARTLILLSIHRRFAITATAR